MESNATDIKTVFDFLQSNPLAVISTIDANTEKPESALIAFAELSTFELIFETYRTARKYQNLLRNNSVAFVIGWNINKYITLQYEGTAIALQGNDIDTYRNIFLQKDTPCRKEFLFHPDVALFKVRPLWIRYSDYTGQKPKIIELNFDEKHNIL